MTSTAAREELERVIEISRKFADEAALKVIGCPVGSIPRERLPRLMWQQSIQDGLSIPLLVGKRYIGSARALLRPQFEALVRGVWLQVIAKEEQLCKVEQGTFEFPGINTLVESLDKDKTGFMVLDQRVVLKEWFKRMADTMHDLTHRGTRTLTHLTYANQDGEDGVRKDAFGALFIATIHTTIAAVALLENAGQRETARQINDAGVAISSDLARNHAMFI